MKSADESDEPVLSCMPLRHFNSCFYCLGSTITKEYFLTKLSRGYITELLSEVYNFSIIKISINRSGYRLPVRHQRVGKVHR